MALRHTPAGYLSREEIMNRFYIGHVDNSALAWSNTLGWVDLSEDDWDTFTLEESETLELPFEGEWVRF